MLQGLSRKGGLTLAPGGQRLFSRMRGKLQRKLECDRLDLVEAVALHPLIEDADLQEWCRRYAKIKAHGTEGHRR